MPFATSAVRLTCVALCSMMSASSGGVQGTPYSDAAALTPVTHWLTAGLPWPNPQCPVVMVECEEGHEERSATGAGAAGSDGASYFNEAEAKLAIRSVLPAVGETGGISDEGAAVSSAIPAC